MNRSIEAKDILPKWELAIFLSSIWQASHNFQTIAMLPSIGEEEVLFFQRATLWSRTRGQITAHMTTISFLEFSSGGTDVLVLFFTFIIRF